MPDAYDRLTQIDNAFLLFEDAQPESAMHVASTQIHDARPLRAADGSLDIERIQEYVVSRLDRIPRYRQRLAQTPLEGHPIWVDDPSFNIHYHVRHSRLPDPGDERQLKRMVGRIFSQRLDRNKPLWELWVIEGLAGDRVAIFSKVHHCMVDGVSGSELIAALLTTEPQEKPDPARTWVPRPLPSTIGLGIDEISRIVRAPFAVADWLGQLLRNEGDVRQDLSARIQAITDTFSQERVSDPLPFNQPIGPHRRIDWTHQPLSRIKEVRQRLGASVNDVVLAVTAGALRRFLEGSRHHSLRGQAVRVMTPVSVRSDGERGQLGNRVSSWTLDLPVDETDPLKRLVEIRHMTTEMKETKRALGVETLTRVTEWTGSLGLSMGARLAARSTPFHLVVTNIPGPQIPLFLLESPLLEIHPHVPLSGTQGLGIALFSYAGTLSWGFTADWDQVPDLHELVLATEEAFDEIHEAALQHGEPATPPRGSRARDR